MKRTAPWFFGLLLAAVASAQPPNTQKETTPLLTPQQALSRVKAPDGFSVGLFAAEPDVRQPVAMAFDGRGRLWVAECYTYAESGAFDLKLRDRIVILEDTDGDGRADRRTVFWDRGQRLTSIEIGFGGVWALCTPDLLFIPDRDGDDRPDGEPEVVLDGWAPAGHTLVNGLRWGPDGWLYGRHGIQGTSRVGPPGATDSERVAMNCGVWRYHPQRKKFEAVCHGTTNPWGMDWNDHGQLFFINTVIGHLWHVVPGAHYRRMYGDDLVPDLYEPIEQTADHVHWDAGESWDTTARNKGVSEGTSRAGGGHAHCGLMFYLGDNWPEKYRDELFTLNLHGRRINREHVERAGATYAGRHRPDLVFWGDPWFRGIDLACGPDGGVYVPDWSDIGECHEADGVHRTTGRVYKITRDGGNEQNPGNKQRPRDLSRLPTGELVDLQLHPNEWYVRQARRVLQERAARGADLRRAHDQLRELLRTHTEVPRRLRALWRLHATGGIDTPQLIPLLDDDSEHVRLWALQLLVDDGVDAAEADAIRRRAGQETSGLVLTFLAAALQRLPAESRFPVAESIASHGEFAGDRVLPLMTWYGVESAVRDHPQEALRLAAAARLPKVTRSIARRLTAAIESRPDPVAGLVKLVRTSDREPVRREVLTGMAQALRGWSKAAAPPGWPELVEQLKAGKDEQLLALARELSLVFHEGLTGDEAVAFVLNRGQPRESRRQAVRSLVAAKTPGVSFVLKKLLADPDLTDEAVRGLAAVDLPAHAGLLVESYRRIEGPGKDAVVEVLATRPDTAARLLDAVRRGVVPRGEVDPFVLRQVQLLGDDRLVAGIAEIWPDRRLIDRDRLKQINAYRDKLDAGSLAAADPARGRRLYARACGQCHKLFGEGGTLGPELTGGQRDNLSYWLENIVDPGAVVPEQFRMSVVALKDGRVLTGLVTDRTARTLTLQTPTDKLTLERSAADAVEPSDLSLMPDGQFDKMTDAEVRDLIAYLMSPHQVEAAGEGDGGPPPGRERPRDGRRAPRRTVDRPLPTPGMGWATFNYFSAMHDEELFHRTADAFERSGLRDAGYDTLRIDGGWWGDDGGRRWYYWTEPGEYAGGAAYRPGDPHVDPRNYPRGLRALADHLHGRGFRLGFYLDPNISMGLADNFPGNGAAEVPPPVRGADLVRRHARWAADNGVDHLFFDGYAWPEEKGDLPFEVMFAELRANAARVGRPIAVSVNGRQSRRLADEWRTGPDIDWPWRRILECLGTVADPGGSGRGRWANPDYFMVGFLGDEEARSQMSLWCVAGAPLYLSHDFRVLNDWDRHVLLNTEAIAVDQDPAGAPGRRVRRDEHAQVWARPLADGTTAVVLLNAGDAPTTVAVRWAELGLPAGRAQVRDLWRHENLGAFAGGYTAKDLPPHGCVFLKVRPGDEPLPEPPPTWAERPGERPDFTPLPAAGWTYRTNLAPHAAGVDNLFDADPETTWSGFARPGGYLQIDFGRPTTIDRLVLDQSIHQQSAGPNPWPYTVYAERSRFRLEGSRDGKTFEPVAAGTLGPRYTIAEFDPVTVQAVRLVPEVETTSAYDDAAWEARDVYLFHTRSADRRPG